jgi:DNA-binding NarL/FixJ family response regulator
VGELVRVMVVDDHPIWAEAVARDLGDAGFDVVATASDGPEALRRVPAARPDVVLLDLQLPVLDGVGVTQALALSFPQVRVLILSSSGEQDDVLQAVKAGASGYLVKSASREELVDAVARTAAGEAVFTAGLAGLVLGEYRRMAGGVPAGSPSGGPAGPELTERETEILRLVAKGLSSRQIAERLVLSPRTVQNHTQNTLTKLQLHNRVELTRYAIERGLDGET